MPTRTLILALAALLALVAARPVWAVDFDDTDVRRAIEKGREYLLSERNADGSFSSDPRWKNCYTSLVLMTLAYMGDHPNREVMGKGLDYLISLDPDRDFNGRQGYALPIRVMAMAYVHNKLIADKQAIVRQKMLEDLNRIIKGQSTQGGWRYGLDRSDQDFSVSQWPILAMYEANRVGIEFPRETLLAAQKYYFRGQDRDGGWGYQFGQKTRGSMTAAGMASLFIISDLIDPASGCPCKGGRSQVVSLESERRIEAAANWVATNFTPDKNPGWDWSVNFDEVYYWLYSVERVGIAAGLKYLGRRNWYKEGAGYLLRKQEVDGSWIQIDPRLRTPIDHWGGGRIPDTCFALLFLYKGRAPILFNKLRFDGVWNPHRRDIANLTHYIERSKEQPFHWQIVDLGAPLEELHDAPILFVSAESEPKWNARDKAQLRAFTDTGGTILFEASCGNPEVRKWFTAFAREVWPEWPLKPCGPDHGVFKDPYPLDQRPEILGIHDGLRTSVFFATDDISCPWHMKAYAGKEYLFRWGINLFTYAMDHGALRAKLAPPDPPRSDRYTETITVGPKRLLRIARVKHAGNWEVGANYSAFPNLAMMLKDAFGLTLQVKEANTPPVTSQGVLPGELKGYDAAFLTGSTAFEMPEEDRTALRKYVEDGGFIWAEAAGGSLEFERSLKTICGQLKWELRPLPQDHPILTGKIRGAQGYNLTAGVEFRHALRLARAAKTFAEFEGIFYGDRLVGVYSPFDTVFGLEGYEAYNCRGYRAFDAHAVVLNVLLTLTVPVRP